jgi:hypothetical protein
MPKIFAAKMYYEDLVNAVLQVRSLLTEANFEYLSEQKAMAIKINAAQIYTGTVKTLLIREL